MLGEDAERLEFSEKLEARNASGGNGALCDLVIRSAFALGLSAFPGQQGQVPSRMLKGGF